MFSTLECLYNQSCVQMMIDGRQFDYPELSMPTGLNGILALDPNMPSRFPRRKLVQEPVMLRSFVEEWINSTDYDNYYDQCQPEVCTYTYTRRSQLITITTNLIGFFGGITVLLRLLVPPCVRLVVWLQYYFSQRLPSQDGNCVEILRDCNGKISLRSRCPSRGSSSCLDHICSTKFNCIGCFREKSGRNC
jgi:hypothetical protein